MQKLPLILAHDYLIQMGGAERVVASMARHCPEAPIYTSVLDRARALQEFTTMRVRTTWMQRLPGMPARFKQYFPLYPSAFRSFGPVSCGVAWISCSTFAKCLELQPTAVSVCYCHNPSRFLWQTEDYVDDEVPNELMNRVARLAFPWLRQVDRQAAQRLDIIVANSAVVRQRIQHRYGREARVVHPPVQVSRFQVSPVQGDYDLIVSRLVGYKRIDRAVEAFTRLGKSLVIVGEGPDRHRLQSMAGPTIRFAGRVPDSEVEHLMARCRAFIFPGEEDFGIAPVEAQACGKPVIAWAGGGALETVKDGVTGIFFRHPSAESLAVAVKQSETVVWDPHAIRSWAETFSEARFLKAMDGILAEASAEHRDRCLRARTASSICHTSTVGAQEFSPHQLPSLDDERRERVRMR